ncbi:MAG: TIGR03617 family F420-dependent LLM class oxidoreductase [Actinomycetia bacterium]|nr:TIGR03617 family F420-dependent LLM class oxidoreductase [Actinomycetes bacterium]MCP4226641.1 TIGR03617 family F420-dependent LLM class oxidoreductase [Actinomycetes bacterium]MCP5033884.1 TIGR03617 family F420-dependent LLM class oxidoreductase [Actinomycetes bacterium]
MEFDIMTGSARWADIAERARQVEGAGFSGMLFTETSATPWMTIAAAAMAAPTLTFSTGIAVAFPRSPMVSAAIAWELAENTEGRFRLGLGSQVRAHIDRRYSSEFDPPGPRLKDYVEAVKACFRAFRGEEKLAHDGPYYQLSLLPAAWRPRGHDHGDIKVDISAVGPYMTRAAGEVADGIHVHPFHSIPYLNEVLDPKVEEGAKRTGRQASDVDLIIPVFTIVGDTEEEREVHKRTAKAQIAFYGSTKNYGFQFDMLGFEGTSGRLNERLKAGDIAGMADLITDEMLEHYAITASWDELGPKLVDRYQGKAARLVTYQAEESLRRDPSKIDRWAAVAEAVRSA